VTDEVQSPPARWTGLRPQLRQWRRYWLRDPLFGGLDFALHHGARMLPTQWCSAIGGRLGILNARYRYQRVRERAQLVYLRLLGDRAAPRDAEAAIMRLFHNVGRVMLEFSVLDRLWADGHIAVAGSEHLLAARAAGKPVILMGLHLANWEVIGPSLIGLGQRGFKFIYQPPRSRFEHQLALAARQRYGAVMLRPGVAAARIARRLLVDGRGVLLIYADDERNGRIGAPLFGRPIPPRANLLNIVRLAWASGAVVIPVYAERLDGARFRVTYLAPVELAPEGEDLGARLIENVHRLDRVITPLVLARLDQWYMLLEYRDD
jgi:Kdo2-lipid IVA lauroyltransferase/acyltransferase